MIFAVMANENIEMYAWNFNFKFSFVFWILTAVKFGRMSKKQREKVEDEAKMVKAARMNGCDDLGSLTFSSPPLPHSSQYTT